jgi:hypothetical protein
MLTLWVFTGCNRNTQEVAPNQLGDAYYPIDTGFYWVYKVRDIQYGADTIDTTYHIKEVIYDVSTDANKTQAVIYVFKKATTDLNYNLQPDSVIVLNKTSYNLSRVENATEYVRLIFPLSTANVWNGNAMNVLLEDQYQLKDYQKSYALPLATFMNTCTVMEEDKFTLVDKDYRKIVYAEQVGPIYSKVEKLRYKTEPNDIGFYRIDYGNFLEKELIAYGK